MHDERYVPSDQQDKMKINNLTCGIATRDDFIEWLFEHSEHCDHISYNEAWQEFEEWEAKKPESDSSKQK